MVLPAGVLPVSSWFSLLVFSQSLHGSPCWCSPSLFMVLPAGVLPVSSWFSLLVFSQSLHGSPCWCSPSLFMVLPTGVLPVSSWFSLLVFSQSLHGSPCWCSPSLFMVLPAGVLQFLHGVLCFRSFVSVSVSKDSSAETVLSEVLRRLDRKEDVSSFSLMEVYMSSKQVQRQTLSPQEKILEKLQEIRKVSLRQMNQTRLVVVAERRGGVLSAQQGVQVSLLIGGLDPLLSREEYERRADPGAADQQECVNEDVLSLSAGHLVSFSHFYSSQGAVALQVSCFSEAERVFMLARDTSVNEKNLSSVVIPEIMLLNPHQVFDISNGGPLAGLHTFREVPRFRVLVSGGTGPSAGCWGPGGRETQAGLQGTPIGIVPLGQAEEVLMDRWTILLDAQHLSEDAHGFLEPPKIVQMNNYFGVYVKVGLQKISCSRSLHKELKLQVDAQEVQLPNIEGLIFLKSTQVDSRYGKPRIDDGLLEVVGVTGVVHMPADGDRKSRRFNYILLTEHFSYSAT
ncbi:hypothetical protein F7725_010681 [Dissostichus mawsoni]|uniref:diacylglycerol kinase (ATP) n=1 Tax=Dissostichus mawsoni TaxID=36200 RepID=A0A7J5XPZ6_DISMA|nr:hypothetical protein F7725_010681 [Dissostichus mawsoni]